VGNLSISSIDLAEQVYTLQAHNSTIKKKVFSMPCPYDACLYDEYKKAILKYNDFT
jgi:hypothetical protein